MRRVFVTFVLLTAVLTAKAGEPYVGAELGTSIFRANMRHSDYIVEGLGAITGKIFAGVMINKYIGIEGQALRIDEIMLATPGAATTVVGLWGWGVAGVGSLPLGDRAALLGRAGFLHWATDVRGPMAGDSDGIAPHAGLGFTSQVSDHFALRADWDYYPIEYGANDIDTYMVGLGGQFSF